jgi:hypothetical protein
MKLKYSLKILFEILTNLLFRSNFFINFLFFPYQKTRIQTKATNSTITTVITLHVDELSI